MIGSAPVLALSGSATSSAIPSNTKPNVGEQITVDISIDVSGVNPPGNSLGGFTGTLDWNPAVLTHNNDSGLLAGFTGVINTANVATGHITFNGANAHGAPGNTIVLSITFDVVGSGSSDLDLEYYAMAAAGTFEDLLPILTVTDGLITVAYSGPEVTIDQASGQADPTNALPINFTAVFSEPVTGFETGDVTLSGSAGATTATVTGSGTTYNVAVSGMTTSGTVIASIGAAVAQDSGANPNEASTSTDNEVTYNLTNNAPTDIELDNNTVDENMPVDTAVGTFTTTDPDVGDTHTYSLVAGTGGDDNASFTIVGDKLRTAEIFDYETKATYTIRVRTTDNDSGSLTYEEVFTININDVDPEPPVVSDIPNQTITTGGTFATINLDNYVTDDDPDADITWTYSGNTELTVDITNRITTITTPSASWTGSETIEFIATDLDTLTDSDPATFTVNAGGGSPGGGDGIAGVLAFGYIIDSQGRISKEARCISEGGEAYLLLPEGTYCLRDGFPLDFIYIQPDGEVNPPIPDYMILISRIFNLGLEGSTFDPPIKLIFNYNPVLVPDDLDELDLVIYRWSPGTGQWIPLETHVDPENQTVWVEITGFSTYTVMLSARPADISVADLTVTPGEINEGEDATVDVLLENDGDYSGTYEAVLEINSAAAEARTVNVAKRSSVTFSFDLTGLAAGTYNIEVGDKSATLTVVSVAPPTQEPTPANFTIGSLKITPGEIDAGQNVDISVRVDNTGETEGVYQVVCKINGSVVGEQQVTLAGGSGETVAFTLAVNDPGTKSIKVNELTGSLIIKEVEEEGSVAEVVPEETTEETATGTSNWWIWVVVGVGVVLIAGAAILIIRIHRSTR